MLSMSCVFLVCWSSALCVCVCQHELSRLLFLLSRVSAPEASTQDLLLCFEVAREHRRVAPASEGSSAWLGFA